MRYRQCLACGEAVEERYTTCPVCGNDASHSPPQRKKQEAPPEPDRPLRQSEVRYYFRHGKRRAGPLTLEELRSMVKVGLLVDSDLLWEETHTGNSHTTDGPPKRPPSDLPVSFQLA